MLKNKTKTAKNRREHEKLTVSVFPQHFKPLSRRFMAGTGGRGPGRGLDTGSEREKVKKEWNK